MLDILIPLVAVTILVFACIGIVFVAEGYLDSHRFQRIEFNKFKELYNLSSDKWFLYSWSVSFDNINVNKVTFFSFNFIDRCRYIGWKHRTTKQQRQEKYSKELQEVISAIKEG